MNTSVIIAVVILYEIVSIGGCALYLKMKERKNKGGQAAAGDDFSTGGQSMTWPVVGASLALSLLGTVKIFGIMQQAINLGAVVAWFSIATIFPLIMISLGTGRWVRRLKVATMPELFGKMYGQKIRLFVCAVIALQTFVILTIETQGLGTVFNALSAGKVSVAMGAIIGGIIGIFYVIIAGMKEVGMVNVVNVIVMYVGLIAAAIILGHVLPGNGWSDFEAYFMSGGQEHMLNFFGAPGVFFSFALNNILALLCAQSVSQMGVQSAITARSEKDIKRAVLVSAPVNGIFGLITMTMGLAGKYMVETGNLSLPEGVKATGQAIGTQVIIQMMPGWVVCLLLAAFLGAILSTFAITTMALGSIFLNNIYILKHRDASEKQKTMVVRIMIVITGVVAMAIASKLPNIINSANWSFAWITPLFFTLVFGLFWKQSRVGAAATMGVSWIVILLYTFTPLPSVLGITLPLIYIVLIVCIVVGVISYAVTKGERGYMILWKEEHGIR